MKIIYKYRLNNTIMMPAGARILSVQVQATRICLWAELDTDSPLEERKFAVFGTGDTPEGKHLATIQDGALVWHIYEQL